MQFAKHLRDGVRLGKIRSSVRIWNSPRVKVGGHWGMGEGGIVVDSIVQIAVGDITDEVAQESAYSNIDDLLKTAKHGLGDQVYLVRFHYLPAGWLDQGQSQRRGQGGLEGDTGV